MIYFNYQAFVPTNELKNLYSSNFQIMQITHAAQISMAIHLLRFGRIYIYYRNAYNGAVTRT
jgi:hypothetical protein